MGTANNQNRESSGLDVLIVEDEALVAMDLEFMLEEAGHIPIGHADDLASALAAVDKRRPDLALVDIQLALGESGLRVAKALHERDIPVLYATGNCPGDKGKPFAIGCLHKPIVEHSLRATLKAVAAKLSGHNIPKVPSSAHLY